MSFSGKTIIVFLFISGWDWTYGFKNSNSHNRRCAVIQLQFKGGRMIRSNEIERDELDVSKDHRKFLQDTGDSIFFVTGPIATHGKKIWLFPCVATADVTGFIYVHSLSVMEILFLVLLDIFYLPFFIHINRILHRFALLFCLLSALLFYLLIGYLLIIYHILLRNYKSYI